MANEEQHHRRSAGGDIARSGAASDAGCLALGIQSWLLAAEPGVAAAFTRGIPSPQLAKLVAMGLCPDCRHAMADGFHPAGCAGGGALLFHHEADCGEAPSEASASARAGGEKSRDLIAIAIR